MSGAPGRSGGRNKVSAEAHRLRGTCRADRHAVAPVFAPDNRRVSTPPRKLLDGLGAAGRWLVRKCIR